MDLFKQFPNSSLPLDDRYLSLFQVLDDRALDTVDLLTLTNTELTRASGRSALITKQLQRELESEIGSTLEIKSLQLQNLESDDRFKKFSTGDDAIDDLLDGGIAVGAVTEIVGAAATGKSHILIQLAITVQLPRELGGLGIQLSSDEFSSTQTTSLLKYQMLKIVYIATEGVVETRRLIQVCKHYQELMSANGINEMYWPSPDNVYVISCHDIEEQERAIMYLLPLLVRKGQVKLVVVDSIAHHLRLELQTRDRSKILNTTERIYRTVDQLKTLACEHELSVVITNQVTDRPLKKLYGNDDEKLVLFDYQVGWIAGWDNESIVKRQNGLESLDYDESNITVLEQSMINRLHWSTNYNTNQVPALGIIWQNAVDCRIVLSKYDQPIWDELLDTIALQEGQDEEEYDISKNFELKRRISYEGRNLNFEIWKNGIRGELSE